MKTKTIFFVCYLGIWNFALKQLPSNIRSVIFPTVHLKTDMLDKLTKLIFESLGTNISIENMIYSKSGFLLNRSECQH